MFGSCRKEIGRYVHDLFGAYRFGLYTNCYIPGKRSRGEEHERNGDNKGGVFYAKQPLRCSLKITRDTLQFPPSSSHWPLS